MMITPERGHTVARTTSEARKSLPELIDWVNRPEGRVILTRHGRRVAALVSLPDLERILSETEMEETIAAIKTGDRRRLPGTFFHLHSRGSSRESAEELRRIQLTRAQERSILANHGLEPVPGGEVEIVVEEKVRKRWWWRSYFCS
ncbi:MAG: type II toxin-antitoxin system Phd/YefM family antitoxin [Pseudomonadota bacterium]